MLQRDDSSQWGLEEHDGLGDEAPAGPSVPDGAVAGVIVVQPDGSPCVGWLMAHPNVVSSHHLATYRLPLLCIQQHYILQPSLVRHMARSLPSRVTTPSCWATAGILTCRYKKPVSSIDGSHVRVCSLYNTHKSNVLPYPLLRSS